MYSGKILRVKVVLFFILGSHCLEMIPQSLKILYTNDKYVQEAHANIRRYSRNGTYYLNLWGEIKHTWGNNITVHVIVTEFLHNEYRRSFIEFHYKFCDMVNKEPMFGQMLVQKGIVCPAPKGEYKLMNMTVQSQHFPNRWPFQKGGAEINVTHTSTKELIAMASIHMLFKQNKN